MNGALGGMGNVTLVLAFCYYVYCNNRMSLDPSITLELIANTHTYLLFVANGLQIDFTAFF